MPRYQPLIPLLRPLATPQRAACQPFFRFSTATRLRVDQPATPASSNAPPPPPSATSTPSPESSSPARAADLAAAEARTDADSAQSPAPHPILPSKRPNPSKLKPSKPIAALEALAAASKGAPVSKPVAPTQPSINLPPPKYHVARSSSKNLPIYTDFKRGGNLHLTTIRRITGDLTALRDELRVFLNKKNEDVKINSLTQQVVVKGHHKPEIFDFLTARGM